MTDIACEAISECPSGVPNEWCAAGITCEAGSVHHSGVPSE